MQKDDMKWYFWKRKRGNSVERKGSADYPGCLTILEAAGHDDGTHIVRFARTVSSRSSWERRIECSISRRAAVVRAPVRKMCSISSSIKLSWIPSVQRRMRSPG